MSVLNGTPASSVGRFCASGTSLEAPLFLEVTFRHFLEFKCPYDLCVPPSANVYISTPRERKIVFLEVSGPKCLSKPCLLDETVCQEYVLYNYSQFKSTTI